MVEIHIVRISLQQLTFFEVRTRRRNFKFYFLTIREQRLLDVRGISFAKRLCSTQIFIPRDIVSTAITVDPLIYNIIHGYKYAYVNKDSVKAHMPISPGVTLHYTRPYRV